MIRLNASCYASCYASCLCVVFMRRVMRRVVRRVVRSVMRRNKCRVGPVERDASHARQSTEVVGTCYRGCIKSIVHEFSYQVCDKVIGFRIIALGIDTEDEILIPLPVLLYIGSWKNPIQVKRASA